MRSAMVSIAALAVLVAASRNAPTASPLAEGVGSFPPASASTAGEVVSPVGGSVVVVEPVSVDDQVVVRAAAGHDFRVHRSIVGDVQRLVDEAAAAGINLGGWGWRSHIRQHELRKENGCPDGFTHSEGEDPSEWAPASACRVPTARPGSSQHEKGLAVDFTYGGKAIGSHSSVAFKWLKANAARFGLKNLPSEPWHWSTTGK